MEPKRWSLALAATRISTANALIPLMLIGLTLRLYGLGQRGFWWDEVNLWNQALTGGIHDQSHAPFPAWIGGLFMALVGSTDTVIFHLPPAICGTLAIVLAYLVTREISDHPTALLAAALFTLSPLAVYYSQEARPYGLFQLTAGMLLLSLMKARRTGRARWWIAYGVSTAICCLVHLLTLQLVIAFGLFYAFMFAYPRLGRVSATHR